MKKTFLIVLAVAVFFMAASAFAEDGFKAYLGYQGGWQESRNTQYGVVTPDASTPPEEITHQIRNRRSLLSPPGGAGSGDVRATSNGFVHGPSADVRYEGAVFVRGTFDYLMGVDTKNKYTNDPTKYDTDLTTWMAEGDIGYRVYNNGGYSVTPYVGFGYFENKLVDKYDHSSWLKDTSMFAALGAIVKYEVSQWSVGLDATGLMPFAGNIKDSDGNKWDNRVGYGARAQIPVTYTIFQKKEMGVGVMLFATPIFQYMDTLKGKSLTNANITNEKTRFSNIYYGLKAGVGLAF